MQEVLRYLRANGYKTYIVTGGGQDFVRVYAEQVYGIPPEQVVGSALGTTYGYDKSGSPTLIKDPRLLLNDNNAGKPEGIHLMIGRRPYVSFGNSTGDRQMLEYTWAGDGPRMSMLVLHDDAKREYAYGPAQGLPDSKVGTFTQALYDEAKSKGWVVVSMKDDWNRIFAFDAVDHARCNEPDGLDCDHSAAPGNTDSRPRSAGDGSPFHTRWVRLYANRFGSACWRTPCVARSASRVDAGTTANPVPAATQAIIA